MGFRLRLVYDARGVHKLRLYCLLSDPAILQHSRILTSSRSYISNMNSDCKFIRLMLNYESNHYNSIFSIQMQSVYKCSEAFWILSTATAQSLLLQVAAAQR